MLLTHRNDTYPVSTILILINAVIATLNINVDVAVADVERVPETSQVEVTVTICL